MTTVTLEYDQCRVVTRARDPDERWDSDDTHTDWTIKGLSLSGGYESIDAPFDIKPGDRLFALYAIYSTGDSFGHDSCGCLEFIDVFTTRAKAEAAMAALTSEPDPKAVTWDERYYRTYINEVGVEVRMYVPWSGYFEHLDEIEIQEFEVTK